VLNEGIARWQLATGESVIAGWRKRLPAWVSWYFGGYLVVWGFMVAGAVGSACGVAAKTLWPDSSLGIEGWTIIHVVVGYVLVRWGRYAFYEKIMEGLIAIMFAVVIFCGVQLAPSFSEFAAGLFIPTVPEGSIWFVLGLMGGVGGSATLLCYGYWLQEKGWSGKDWMPRSRWDLGVAYSLTGLFGLAMVVIAAGAKPEDASGPALVVALSERLGIILGTTGRTIFLGGFWCAVFSSLLGVFQGVPYLFSDWWRCRGKRSKSVPGKFIQSSAYRYFLLFLAGPPLLLQLLGKPLLIVVIYAVVGAFFMPFLAGTLLVMNNRKEWVAEFKNSWPVNVGLIVSLVLFALLFLSEIGKQLFA
jgi:Mn2+/Fe2+ NRAMP family transporter